MRHRFDKRRVLASNPKIDKRLVESFERLERELQKLGVDTKSKYTLSPPLGGGTLNAFNNVSTLTDG